MNKGFSSLDLYYKDVSKFALLSREDETALGAKVQKRGKESKKAVSKLIESNLRLVAKIALGFQGRGLDIEDLISEGNIGLSTAAKKFDPSKGAKFSYYASFWIKQGIFRAVANQGRLIRIPVNSLGKYFKILTYISAHERETGEKPSREEIAKKFNMSKKRIIQITRAAETVIPLDAKAGKEGETKIHDTISDKGFTPYESVAQAEDHRTLKELVKKLPKREAFIIENRFGLNSVDKKTLEVLGQNLKITRERVRQLEGIALVKLKALARGKLDR